MPEDKRQNEIIRIQKKRNNFVLMDKGFFDDARLSFKAKGILGYLLSKPDNWKVIVKDLINHAKDGRDSIYAGLKELKECGYYSKTPIRNEKGIVTHWESTIFEDPSENPENTALYPLPDFPDTAKPDTVLPETEKPERNNNYLNNNYVTKNKSRQGSQSASYPQEKNAMTRHDMTDDTTQQNFSEMKKELPQSTASQSKGLNEAPLNNQSNFNQHTTYAEWESRVKSNISYEYFIKDRQPYIKLINEIVSNIVGILTETSEFITLNKKENKRIRTVDAKEICLRLEHNHILYVLEKFRNVAEPVTHKGNYLKAIILSSLTEMESYYQNEYRQGNL